MVVADLAVIDNALRNGKLSTQQLASPDYLCLSDLFVVVVDGDWFQVLCLKNLSAIQTLNVVDPIAPRDHRRSLMLTGWRHRIYRIGTIFDEPARCVKGG